jgi:hypothetical protein
MVAVIFRYCSIIAVLYALALSSCTQAVFAEDGASSGNSTDGASTPGVLFVGSTPCEEKIRGLVGVPADARADLMAWKLNLRRNPSTDLPETYDLRCDYGMTAAGKPGLVTGIQHLERQGTWTISKGIKSDPDAIVIDLDGKLSLLQVGSNILHVLNPDRTLMTGNGGWSYTLNRNEVSEPRVDATLALSQPNLNYDLSPLSSGSQVYGIFHGRTPYHGIARELAVAADPASTKLKWMVTLYHNKDTHEPTTYKVEGSLFRSGARTGKWSIIRGAAHDADAIVYRLEHDTQPPILFFRGDDNVLFFLDQKMEPLVGNAEFSYTLDRRRQIRLW